MNNTKIVLFFSFLLCTSFYLSTKKWGFFGHQRINKMAVFTLPPEMIPFFKKNIEYLSKHAVDPDKRRYRSTQEAPRHYIDIDHYGVAPFPEVPRRWLSALAKFTDVFVVSEAGDTLQVFGNKVVDFGWDTLTLKGAAITSILKKDSFKLSKKRYLDFVKTNIDKQFYELKWVISLENLDSLFRTNQFSQQCKSSFAVDELSKYGIVPWHLEKMLFRLTYAFKDNDLDKILRYAAEIGHYVGDAHVPLHTTENYNGQMTGQTGIHGFWESRLPELYAGQYSFFVGKAEYIDKPNEFFWDIVLASHSHLDSVLLIEKDLTARFPSDQKYCFETRGEYTVRTYCEEFSNAYHERLKGMVEERMRAAIKTVGDVWFTAWVNAGQPDLTKLLNKKPLPTKVEEIENVQDTIAKVRPHEN